MPKQKGDFSLNELKKGKLYILRDAYFGYSAYFLDKQGVARDQNGKEAPEHEFYRPLDVMEAKKLALNLRATAEKNSKLVKFIGESLGE